MYLFLISIQLAHALLSKEYLEEAKQKDSMVEDVWIDLMEGYDKAIRPNYTGAATMVSVDMTVMRFGKLDEVDMTFMLDLFFRQEWTDYRLRHNLSTQLTPTLGHGSPSDFIWTPDTVFINAQKAWSHSVTVTNTKLDIYPNGNVFWASRVSVEANCLFDLRNYPMDTQTCDVGIESYAYNNEQLLYQWDKNPIRIINRNLSQYTITRVNSTAANHTYAMGVYVVLTAEFTFKRRIAFSILQIFFPCVAIVSISWSSLWLHKHCTSARVGIGVTTLLTISTIWGSVNRRLPRVSYVKAVDVYFMTSFSFIFMTLIEYTLVLNGNFPEWKKEDMKRKVVKSVVQSKPKFTAESLTPKALMKNTYNARKRRNPNSMETVNKSQERKRKKSENVTVCHLDQKGQLVSYTYTNNNSDGEQDDFLTLKKHEVAEKHPMFIKLYVNPRRASYVDIVSRFLFPLLYLCFNLFFWKSYKGVDDGKH